MRSTRFSPGIVGTPITSHPSVGSFIIVESSESHLSNPPIRSWIWAEQRVVVQRHIEFHD